MKFTKKNNKDNIIFKIHNDVSKKVARKGVKSFLESFFYKVGTSIEIYILDALKTINRFFSKGLDLVIRGFKKLGEFNDKFFDALLDDLGEPFEKIENTYIKMQHIYKHEKASSNTIKGFFKTISYILKGFVKNRVLVSKLLGYVVPAIAVGIFTLVVYSNFSNEYAIDVLMDGEVIGTVQNYSTIDKADTIIQSQLVSTDDQEWNPSTEIELITLSNTDDSVIDERQLANNILNSSTQNIVQATGLYVDGEFYGAAENSDELNATIDGMLAPYENGAENRTVSFVQDVSVIDGVFFTDSIKDEDDMVEMITGEVSGEKWYYAVSGDSPSAMAQKNGITLSTLYQLNPHLENGGSLQIGDAVLVGASVPFLQVKYVETEVREQIIAHGNKTENNNSMTWGTTSVSQTGVDGVNELLVEVEYIDGIAVKETILSTTVISEPITEITQIGTLWNGQVIEPGSGVYLWPTTNFRWSRGFTGQYPAHNGIDLAAPYGTPIVAVDSGIVTKATYTASGYGWHLEISHGNGYSTLYAHCSSLAVGVGQSVQQGQIVAYIGSTGWSTGNHIHFEVKSGSYRYNPLNFLP